MLFLWMNFLASHGFFFKIENLMCSGVSSNSNPLYKKKKKKKKNCYLAKSKSYNLKVDVNAPKINFKIYQKMIYFSASHVLTHHNKMVSIYIKIVLWKTDLPLLLVSSISS